MRKIFDAFAKMLFDRARSRAERAA
jgi:hypothetical protein